MNFSGRRGACSWCLFLKSSCLPHLARKESWVKCKLWVSHNESTVSCVLYAYPLAANWLIRVWKCIWLAVIRLSRGSGGLNSRWCWEFTHKPFCQKSEDALCCIYTCVCVLLWSKKSFPIHAACVRVCVCPRAPTKTCIMFPFPSLHMWRCARLRGGWRVPGQTVNSTQPSGIALRQMSCNDWETQGSSLVHTVSLSRARTHTLSNL